MISKTGIALLFSFANSSNDFAYLLGSATIFA
jgi:hypothetical protein